MNRSRRTFEPVYVVLKDLGGNVPWNESKLWNISWDLWTHHNSELHNSAETQGSILEADINTAIQQAFDAGTVNSLVDAYHLLWEPINQVLSQNQHYQ